MRKKEFTYKYSFKAVVWKYKGSSSWYFVSLPTLLGKKIRKTHFTSEEGWGRLKTTAHLGKTVWQTAIWYDKKQGTYILPLKVSVRKSEDISINTNVRIKLEIESEPLFGVSRT